MLSNFYVSAVYRTCANLDQNPSLDNLSHAAYVLYTTIGADASRDIVVYKRNPVVLSASEVNQCLYGINKFLGKNSEKFMEYLEVKLIAYTAA